MALLHHEALAVIIHDAGEFESERGVAAHRPCRVARQDIDFAGLQRREALLGGQRRELHFLCIVEDRGSHGAAEIDIHAGPVVLLIGKTEADQTRVHAALYKALGLHIIERAGRRSSCCNQTCSGSECQTHKFTFHNLPSF